MGSSPCLHAELWKKRELQFSWSLEPGPQEPTKALVFDSPCGMQSGSHSALIPTYFSVIFEVSESELNVF